MEGVMLVPPERGTILGRALWKSRYVVVGNAQSTSAGRAQGGLATPRGPPSSHSDSWYLSIYKDKNDWEPIQQHALSSVTDCQIQMVAHRKQGPVLPTLIVHVSPDPATDKLRKRRSSRTAGLTTTKDTAPTTLWFRPENTSQTNLPDWSRCIQSLMPSQAGGSPMSPATPASATFITGNHPFSPRPREPSDFYQRPGSGNPNSRSTLSHKTSAQTHSSRDRPLTYSESPSLRSKRSDLSHASSMNPSSHAPFGVPVPNFSMPYPTDLPSPATTVGEYQGEFIEGWTSAQGRSSTISSAVRGRDSISSQPPGPPPPAMASSSPPGPRETILDRAFHLRRIPGSDRGVPGEEKLTSLARFDALMREADEKRKRTPADVKAKSEEPKSGWDLDDDDDDDDDSDADSDEGGEDDEGDDAHEAAGMDESVYMPSTAQRALQFIAARHEPRAAARDQGPKSRVDCSPETPRAPNSGYSSYLRPQTGYRKQRPAVAQRTHSQPQLAALAAAAMPSPVSSTLDVPSSSSAKTATSDDGSSLRRSITEKRQSSSSTKRLSFTEFAKRLSSTSSLLLVQTNASGGSSGRVSGGGGEAEAHQAGSPLAAARGAPRGGDLASPSSADGDRRCGWRGSVGVFGAEGGFL